MDRPRFGQLIALTCMAALAACTGQSDGEGPSGNTNINLTINGGNISDTFYTANYEIACDGADTGPADTPDGIPIDDQRAFAGNFEVTGNDPSDGAIFEVLMDLPLGECFMRIYVNDEDETICTGETTITIVSGDSNVFDINVVCDVSLQTPVGNATVLADFTEVTGNFCPFVNIFNSLDRNPEPGDFEIPMEFRAMDIGDTCGGSCDCTSAEAIIPGACSTDPPTELDIGLAASCCAVPASALTGNPLIDSQTILAACTAGIGNVGQFVPGGPFQSPESPPENGTLALDLVYNCAGGASPAAGAIVPCCVATDGDSECAKIKCDYAPTICPGDNQCDGSASCTAGSTNECPDGQGGFATCESDGTCPVVDCVDASNDCLNYGTCNIATGLCSAPTPKNDGALCSTNVGSGTTIGCNTDAGCASDQCNVPDAACAPFSGCCEPIGGQCIAETCEDANYCDGTKICASNAQCGDAGCDTVAGTCNPVDCDDNNFCTADGTCPPATGLCPAKTPANGGLGCTPGSGAPGGPGTCVGTTCVVADPDPISCDPTVGDTGCEIGCNAAANDFGLPSIKTVDPGNLTNSPADVCFSGAIPLTQEFIAAANNALNTTFAIARITPGIIANSGSPQTMSFQATVGATGPIVAAPGPTNAEFDLLNFPPSGVYFISFTEACGSYTLPASGQDLCFNIAGSAADKPSITSFAALAIDTTGYNNLVATFNCGPALLDGLGVDCTQADPSVCVGTNNCELDVPCTTNADCTVNGNQVGACGADNLCDTAGTCEVAIVDDPNEGEICFVRP